MPAAEWLDNLLAANVNFSFAVIEAPTFLKSEDAGHILKSEAVTLGARTALSWDWRIPHN
jgi:hypothetical protein